MNATITIDTRQFDTALALYLPTTKKSLADVLNKRALNIGFRALKATPAADRAKIRAYLDAPATRGKSIGLARKHLILQARRARRGLKGLYGVRMKQAVAKFVRAQTNKVGFLRAVWFPIIRGLGKSSAARPWARTTISSTVQPAVPSQSPTVQFTAGTKSNSPQDGKRRQIVSTALQSAFDAEAREITRHVEAKMRADIAKFFR